MMLDLSKVELLAPAGGEERLRYALHYGADAVYCGASRLSLRAFADNFDLPKLKEMCDYVHARGKKLYLTLNAFLRNDDLPALPAYCKDLAQAGIDAIIVSDPAALVCCKESCPELDIHISTQANTLNHLAARFWYDAGASRIILARELGLDDIRQMRDHLPDDLELEYFVHGAMCMSYSGRCLLSNYLDGRDGNRGACVQPCRWNYEFRERGKDGLWYSVAEDEQGSYLFNANDLNLIGHLRDLIEAGVTSLKIEGRMKTAYYVGTVVNAYRMALEALGRGEALDEAVAAELENIRHRPYCSGFALGEGLDTARESQSENAYEQGADFVALVLEYDAEGKRAKIQQRNKFLKGDSLELLSPGQVGKRFLVEDIEDEYGNRLEAAPHPKQCLYIPLEGAKPMDMIRKPNRRSEQS